MIHVCFALYDKIGRYSKFTGTAICSIFENISPPPNAITVHILHDNTLTQDNRDKFIYLAGRYGQCVKFYNVEELCADKIAEINILLPNILKTRFSIATFYRFFIPQVLSPEINKAIYLDSDIIVNLDINELWQINLADKPLGAVPEILIETNPLTSAAKKNLVKNNLTAPEDYFNAGVLLINLKVMRDSEKIISRGLKFLSEHQEMAFPDQDVLNYLFSKNYLKLPERFDVFLYKAREEKYQPAPAIYHYISDTLQLHTQDPFNRLWFKYFVKTPWFNEETIGRLYAGVQQMHVGFKQSMIKLSAMMSGKTRAFVILSQGIEAIRELFSIRDDEEIILADNQESLQKLLKEMKRSLGKKVFFIMFPNFPFNLLIQEGFVYGRDFLIGAEFLSEAQGMPMNSYQLVKEL